jgi:7-cyano-7-deazaguanine synthase
VYPDCRPEFIQTINTAVSLATDQAVGIRAPFISKTKTDIAYESTLYQAPLHMSWSCYEGGERHCGRCGTCQERIEAFLEAGLTDPTLYAL